MATERPLIQGRDVTVLPDGMVAWRNERKLSQEALARAAKVSEGLVALIETGRRQPTYGNAIRLADALGIPLRAFALVHAGEQETTVEPEAAA